MNRALGHAVGGNSDWIGCRAWGSMRPPTHSKAALSTKASVAFNRSGEVNEGMKGQGHRLALVQPEG
jgi:hypothetical protein